MMTFKEALRKNLLGMQKFAEDLLENGVVCSSPLVDKKYIVVDANTETGGHIRTICIFNYNKKTKKLKTQLGVWLPALNLKPLQPRRVLTTQEMNEVLRGKVVDKLKGLIVPDKEGTLHTL